MNILVTGSAGFIGSQLCINLLERGDKIIGLDNLNDYYNIDLKKARLERHLNHKNYSHYHVDISDKDALAKVFKDNNIDVVVNLAAQAGVRYSIENPDIYIQSNIVGFMNILECCRHNMISNLVYASSSSVYGANTTKPFSVHDNVDHPLSLYAASKKSNELMAHTYSNLFDLSTTGLRFFTVYGPWGRPDMALFKFTRNISIGNKVELFNYGNHQRDFTYVDDIVKGLQLLINKPSKNNVPFEIFNIGKGKPNKLLAYLKEIEKNLKRKSKITKLPMQKGDIKKTHSDITKLKKYAGYNPATDIKVGIKKFIDWYKTFY